MLQGTKEESKRKENKRGNRMGLVLPWPLGMQVRGEPGAAKAQPVSHIGTICKIGVE